MLRHAMLRYAMLCYAMLCYAMPCYAMLCHAMLCYAMLCHAMDQAFDEVPPAIPAVATVYGLLVVAALVAWRLDLGTIYVARAPDVFYPTTLRQLLGLNCRLYSSLFRAFHIAPGYVPYSRLQVIVLLTIAVMVNAICALLFAGLDLSIA